MSFVIRLHFLSAAMYKETVFSVDLQIVPEALVVNGEEVFECHIARSHWKLIENR